MKEIVTKAKTTIRFRREDGAGLDSASPRSSSVACAWCKKREGKLRAESGDYLIPTNGESWMTKRSHQVILKDEGQDGWAERWVVSELLQVAAVLPLCPHGHLDETHHCEESHRQALGHQGEAQPGAQLQEEPERCYTQTSHKRATPATTISKAGWSTTTNIARNGGYNQTVLHSWKF